MLLMCVALVAPRRPPRAVGADFDRCHVYGARQFDTTSLSKSTNTFPREVYFFKGPRECDKMIVLYDEDGKKVRASARSGVPGHVGSDRRA